MNATTEIHTVADALKENEERLRFALEASNHGIWDWNIATGGLYFSPSWKRLFGFADDEIKNCIDEWENRIHPDDKAQLMRDLHTHFNSEQPVYENCYRFRAKDGSYRWIQGCGKIVSRAADGTPLRMIGTHTDITEKRESEEQYRQLFNLIPLPTWIYDYDTLQFLAVNQAAIEYYGYTRDAFLQMTILEVRPPEQQACLKEALDDRELQETTTYSNWKHKKKSGEIIVVEMKSTTIFYNGRKARLVVVNDITQKVRAEAELKRSHQQFQYVSKATSDAIYDLNIITGHLAWGEGLMSLFGHAAQNIDMPQWEAHIHADDRAAVLQSFYETLHLSRKKFWKKEYRFLAQDGTYRYVIDKGFIVRDAQQPLRVIGAMQDITNLKRQQIELAESNKRYEYATLAISDVIWDWLIEKDCVLWSDNYENVTGWKLPTDKCINVETCIARFHETDRERTVNSMNEALQNKAQTVWECELKYLKYNGETAHIYNRAYIMRNEAGEPTRMIGAMQDFSQRKKLEEQLLQEELNKQKEISKATINTQEKERAEIGRELHDNVNQVLTTTKLYLELAQSKADLKDELLGKAQQNIMYVINEIRQLSRSLMNPSLGDLGLVDAIHDLIESVQATRKLQVRFETSGAVAETLPDNLDVTIYRIIQEALNNVVRHAQATVVCIFLERTNKSVELQISDNGAGFDPEAIKYGAGLKNMKNRVYLANGTLDLKTAPGAGCAISIYFNLENIPIQ